MQALANGTFPTGKHLAPKLLNTCLVNTIQAFFHKSWHYMDAYRFEFTHYCSGFSWSPLIIFAAKDLMQSKLNLLWKNTASIVMLAQQ